MQVKSTQIGKSKPLKILLTGSFTDLRQEGAYYLDKTHFIPIIEELNSRSILSLRPRRFGKRRGARSSIDPASRAPHRVGR